MVYFKVVSVIQLPTPRAYKAIKWFDANVSTVMLSMQRTSGIISWGEYLEKYDEKFSKEFHCKLVRNEKLHYIEYLEFEDDKYMTWFLLNWS